MLFLKLGQKFRVTHLEKTLTLCCPFQNLAHPCWEQTANRLHLSPLLYHLSTLHNVYTHKRIKKRLCLLPSKFQEQRTLPVQPVFCELF